MAKPFYHEPYEYKNNYLSISQAKWQALYRIAPALRVMYKDFWADRHPPKCLDDRLFIALCASFADPKKREILRALILDVLMDDLCEVFQGKAMEDQQ